MPIIKDISGNAAHLVKKGVDRVDVDAIKEKAGNLKDSVEDTKEKLEQKRNELDNQLTDAIYEYNEQYAKLNDEGINLFLQRSRAVDVIDNVSQLVSSIANSPKSFEAAFEEVQKDKAEFRNAEDFAVKELDAARQAAGGAGAGIAAGAAVMAAAPTGAMWIATTFGTASTGTAISALSGVAAENAALAWLGGGALAAGGGGMSAGSALLALAGPVGMGIAGMSLLASIALFTKKRIKNTKEKHEEIASVKKNTAELEKCTYQIQHILAETVTLRDALAGQFSDNMGLYEANYSELDEEAKLRLGTMVNNTKALSALFKKTI